MYLFTYILTYISPGSPTVKASLAVGVNGQLGFAVSAEGMACSIASALASALAS